MQSSNVEHQPRFIITLDDADASPLVRIPLAVTGEWVRGAQRFAITPQDLDDIFRNFQERLNGEINVDYDHASEMPEVAAGGPIPSAGRITRLDAPAPLEASASGANESTAMLLWGWYEPTPRAQELIRNREYRYISPAIDWSARHKRTGTPQGTTITSVALTNRPFLEELPQIRLSDPSFVACGAAADSSAATPPTVQPLSSLSGLSGGSMNPQSPTAVSTPAAHPPAAGTEMLASENAAQTGGDGRSAALTEFPISQALGLLSESEARGKVISAVDFFHFQVEQEVDAAVKAGKILPRQREDWKKIALADARTFRSLVSDQKPQVPLHPLGVGGAGPEDPQTQVRLLAEQRMQEHHISFAQALSEVARENPALAHEYRRAVTA